MSTMNNELMPINWNAVTAASSTQNENVTMFSGMFTILNGYLIIALNNFAHKICHNICASITTYAHCTGTHTHIQTYTHTRTHSHEKPEHKLYKIYVHKRVENYGYWILTTWNMGKSFKLNSKTFTEHVKSRSAFKRNELYVNITTNEREKKN